MLEINMRFSWIEMIDKYKVEIAANFFPNIFFLIFPFLSSITSQIEKKTSQKKKNHDLMMNYITDA